MGAVQDENRAKYQVKVQEVRPPRSRMNMNAGEDLPVLQQVRYAGREPTLQEVERVQRRRQQAAVNGQHGQLCAKGVAGNKARKDTGEQGKKNPKKAAAEGTKGTKAAKNATGKGSGEGQKGKGKGGGGSRPAPARAAKGKTRPIVCDSDVDDCDSDYAMVYGSKSDLGWGKKARVRP